MTATDLFMNGAATGSVAQMLLNSNMDYRALQVWREPDGRSFRNMVVNGKEVAVQVQNAGFLTREEWVDIDRVVLKSARLRLQAVADVLAAGLTYNVPGGLGKTVIQQKTMTDVYNASISMDGLREADRFAPVSDLVNFPLPLIHSDWSWSIRDLAVSRQGDAPLDMTSPEAAAFGIAEQVEMLLIGLGSYSFGGGTIYGYLNHPDRTTFAMTDYTGGTWTPEETVADVIAMKDAMRQVKMYGPWVLYFSPDWDLVLDQDYSSAKGDNTLRQRIAAINGISKVATLDHLPSHTCVMVRMQSNTVRMVNFLPLTTLQWDTHGGMAVNFKTVLGQVPQVRANGDGNAGVCHGSF